MIPAPIPDDEADRLAALHSLQLLGAPSEERFDRVTRLTQRTFGTPIVAFSLVDEDRQFFASRIGLRASETPRDQAFCAHAILDSEVMVVPDATVDPRFHDNPLVTGDPDIRFYAGAPVRTASGQSLGTLCVIDTEPREWTPQDSEALTDLARLVEEQLGEARATARSEALGALTAITTLHTSDPHELLRQGLQIACDYLEMPEASITSLHGRTIVVEVANSQGAALESTGLDLGDGEPYLFADADAVEWCAGLTSGPHHDHPLADRLGVECAIGTGLTLVDDDTQRSLAFFSPRPLTYGEFTDDEVEFVGLLARWAEGVLERERQERLLARKRSLLALIRSAQATFIATPDRQAAFATLLSDILTLTRCEYGFIAERHLDDEGRPYIRTRALTNIAWNAATRDLYEREHARGLVFDNPNTLFGVTMTTGEPVISNAPASDPRSGGRPDSHPPLDSYLGLPLLLGGEFVGVMGLANRPGGFEDSAVEFLEPLATTVAQLITVARAQDEHRANQSVIRRLSTVVQQMTSGVIITDLEGHIQWANASFERLFGYELAELSGIRPRDVFHAPGTDDESETSIREAMDRHEGFSAEMRVMRRDGERIWISVASTPLVEDSDAVGYVVIIDDISERKRVERMKDEFVSTISHELRTPLTSITGSLALVGSGAAGELTERTARMVAIAEQNAQRLSLLIDDLLDLEKLLQGGIPIEAEAHPLMPLIERAVVDNQAYATRHGATITVGGWVDEAVVFVDSVRFVQIMSNLLSNAAKFSPEGGTIDVRARVDGESVSVSVHDEGPGVPEDFRDRIFERFAQADASDRRARGGSGLGLAITKELVERMGGAIGYDYSPDDGSVFTFTLPRVRERRSGGDRRLDRE